jgi:hypothetical protein
MGASSMLEVGWVWEGFAFDPEVEPTVYGVGEGATYFGVPGANFMFHPNNQVNFAKLGHVPRVTADISKWVWYPTTAESTGRHTFAQRRDDEPAIVAAEAEKVSRLSLEFPNVVAAFIDDTHGVCAHDTYTADTPRDIREALHRHNPNLDLWIVVYTHELDKEYWRDWRDDVDVINLWVWESANLPHIEEYIPQCRELFPKQRLVMGVYMRDYTLRAPVPLEMLEIELEAIARHLEAGTLDGYSILAACLIDQHPEQAEFIREFIHEH